MLETGASSYRMHHERCNLRAFLHPTRRYVSVQLTGCPGVPLTHIFDFVSVATGLLAFSAGPGLRAGRISASGRLLAGVFSGGTMRKTGFVLFVLAFAVLARGQQTQAPASQPQQTQAPASLQRGLTEPPPIPRQVSVSRTNLVEKADAPTYA